MANTIQFKRSSVAAKAPTTSDLSLGEIGINTHDGKVYIKKNDGADAIIEVGANVTVQARNDTGATITKGSAVYVAGTHASGKPNVALADSDGSGTYPAVGLASNDISDGGEGTIVISGLVENLNTSSYSAGDALYLDTTPGAITATKPTANLVKVQKIGVVTRSHASAGSIVVIGAGRANEVTNEIIALTGVAVDSVDLGTFTGSIIQDNRTIKAALQDLETSADASASSLANLGGGITSAAFQFSSTTSAGSSSGSIRFNSSTPASVTEVYLSIYTKANVDISNVLPELLHDTSRVYIQVENDSSKYLVANVNGDITDNGSYFTIPINNVTAGSLPSNQDKTQFAVVGGDPSLLAKLESPALTGTPTAPTASQATNTTQIATTAYVQSNLSASLLRSALGIVSAANDGASGLASGSMYYNTTSGTYVLVA